ncbi:E2F-associated phosphoprotein-domain-containing protein, partial [Gorgonomyces haynaldii]
QSEDELYDEEEDDLNQEYVDQITTRESPILCCPLCFTTVCRDCQEHEEYKNQFRAMFVENVRVLFDQVLKAESSVYHPVRCLECECEIGVYQDEVYHFFHVIA